MNERIKKLYEQAGLVGANGHFEYDFFDPEKFAQLMVRECMNAVCDPRTIYLESMTESSAMYAARERIRKHFGVGS